MLPDKLTAFEAYLRDAKKGDWFDLPRDYRKSVRECRTLRHVPWRKGGGPPFPDEGPPTYG